MSTVTVRAVWKKNNGSVESTEHYCISKFIFIRGRKCFDYLEQGSPYIILSRDCLQKANESLMEYLQGKDVSYIIIQSWLRSVVENSSRNVRKLFKKFLLRASDDKNSFKWVVFLDESYSISAVSFDTLSLFDKLKPKILCTSNDDLLTYSKKFEVVLISEFCSNESEQLSSSFLSIKMDPPTSQYSQYVSWENVEENLKTGQYFRGVVTEMKKNGEIGFVALVNSTINNVAIFGKCAVNRALPNDNVIVRLIPRPSSYIVSELTSDLTTSMSTHDSSSDSFDRSDNQICLDDTVHYGEVVFVARSKGPISCIVPNIDSQLDSMALDSMRDHFVLVVPLDPKYPKIRVFSRNWSYYRGFFVVVSIDDWPVNSDYPNGHIEKILGERGNFRDHVDALAIQYDVPLDGFSCKAMECLPFPSSISCDRSSTSNSLRSFNTHHRCEKKTNWTPMDLRGRKDMRGYRVFSVDPPGCQDIDDAMHVRWLNDGIFEVGVSIADVCEFVPKDCPLDIEARNRATTLYLVHNRFDMLPSMLSSDICSIHEKRDRFAVTVTWKFRCTCNGKPVSKDADLLDPNSNYFFEILGVDFDDVSRTVVHSVAAMTYAQAHCLIYDKKVCNEDSKNVPEYQAGGKIDSGLWSDLSQDLRTLTAIARHLRLRRGKAIDVDGGQGSELRFNLDENSLPTEIIGKDNLEIHHTIEELMVFANATVAKINCMFYPMEALVRIHSPPPPKNFSKIRQLCQELGVDAFQSLKKKDIYRDLQTFRVTLSEKKVDPSIITLISTTVIMALTEARYITLGKLSGKYENVEQDDAMDDSFRLGHYGLGLVYYTHFTSPIRRYADVIVHRQLLQVLEMEGWKERYQVLVKKDTQTYLFDSASEIALPEKKITISLPKSSVPSILSDVNDLLVEGNNNDTSDSSEPLDSNDLLDDLLCSSEEPSQSLDDLLDDLLDGNTTVAPMNITEKNVLSDFLDDLLDNQTSIPSGSSAETLIPLDSATSHAHVDKVLFSADEVEAMAFNCNQKHRMSRVLQYSCQLLFMQYFFLNHEEFHPAKVINVGEKSLSVFIHKYNISISISLVDSNNRICLCDDLIQRKDIPRENMTDNEVLGSLSSGFKKKMKVFPTLRSTLVSNDRVPRIDFTSSDELKVFSISRMDDIIVNIYSINSRSATTPRLVVNIASLSPKSKYSDNNNNSSDVEQQALSLYNNERSSGDAKDRNSSISSAIFCYSKNIRTELSVFRKGQKSYRLRSNMSPELKFSPLLQGNVLIRKDFMENIEVKQNNTPKRCRLEKSGRIGFGEIVCSSFPYRDSMNSNSKPACKLASITKALGQNKIEAMKRMQALGEEWASEEDLPDSYQEESHLGDMDDGDIMKTVGKEFRISQQRLGKLVTEKRKSRKYG